MIRRIEREAWRSTPWGAGQGVTHELWRIDDGAPGYVARVSVADIVASGPFTPMPGYRRWLTVLDEGEGLTLTCASRVWRGVRGDAIELDGAEAVEATVISAARVWNLIARADVPWTASWSAPGAALELSAGTTVVHRGEVAIDGEVWSLAPDGTLLLDGDEPRRIDVHEPAIVIHLAVAA